MSFAIQTGEQFIARPGVRLRHATVTLTADALVKSAVINDGFGARTIKSGTVKDVYIDWISGRNATVKMFITEDIDAITEAEEMTQHGQDIKVFGGFNVAPLATIFTITANKNLTFKSDKPVKLRLSILL